METCVAPPVPLDKLLDLLRSERNKLLTVGARNEERPEYRVNDVSALITDQAVYLLVALDFALFVAHEHDRSVAVWLNDFNISVNLLLHGRKVSADHFRICILVRRDNHHRQHAAFLFCLIFHFPFIFLSATDKLFLSVAFAFLVFLIHVVC